MPTVNQLPVETSVDFMEAIGDKFDYETYVRFAEAELT